MKLLVTGGCGFIGSNFINHYYHENPDVSIINIDAMYYAAKEDNISEEIRKSDRYVFVHGNIQSLDLIRYIINLYQITHIIHFAAQSHVQNSFEDSLKYTQDNILGTHTLLESCRQYKKIEKFIHVSTDEVYGESNLSSSDKMSEMSLLSPTNPYAATKAAAEMIVMSYHRSFNIPILITRGNNVYGPNQYPEKVIPRFIELLKNNQKLTIQGDGKQQRNFLHTYDVVRAFSLLLSKGVEGEIYNIGGKEQHEYSIYDIASILIKKIKGVKDVSEWIEHIEDRPFNDQRYNISNNKLIELGWDPVVTLEEGLNSLLGL